MSVGWIVLDFRNYYVKRPYRNAFEHFAGGE